MVSGGELNVRIIYGLLTTLKKLLSENRKTKNDFVAVTKYLICDKYEFLYSRFSNVTRFLNLTVNLEVWPLVLRT